MLYIHLSTAVYRCGKCRRATTIDVLLCLPLPAVQHRYNGRYGLLLLYMILLYGVPGHHTKLTAVQSDLLSGLSRTGYSFGSAVNGGLLYSLLPMLEGVLILVPSHDRPPFYNRSCRQRYGEGRLAACAFAAVHVRDAGCVLAAVGFVLGVTQYIILDGKDGVHAYILTFFATSCPGR